MKSLVIGIVLFITFIFAAILLQNNANDQAPQTPTLPIETPKVEPKAAEPVVAPAAPAAAAPTAPALAPKTKIKG